MNQLQQKCAETLLENKCLKIFQIWYQQNAIFWDLLPTLQNVLRQILSFRIPVSHEYFIALCNQRGMKNDLLHKYWSRSVWYSFQLHCDVLILLSSAWCHQFGGVATQNVHHTAKRTTEEKYESSTNLHLALDLHRQSAPLSTLLSPSLSDTCLEPSEQTNQ